MHRQHFAAGTFGDIEAGPVIDRDQLRVLRPTHTDTQIRQSTGPGAVLSPS